MLLVDTNLLAYAHDPASQKNPRAKEILSSALKGELEACISYQNVLELYGVLTNPSKLDDPYPPEEAAGICGNYINSKNLIKIIPSESSYRNSLKLARRGKVKAAKVFDCLLAATAKENGVETIYTENIEDFRAFDFLESVNPFKKS